MDTIKNYLETMFANMPNTPEVMRAKSELYGMMEDKYNELISQGKSENEAVGTVISEFGNLDELSDILGLNNNYSAPVDNRRILSMDEVKSYISAYSRYSFLIALGVFLCITSPICAIVGEMYKTTLSENIGAAIMMLIIAVAVGLFILSGLSLSKYSHIAKKQCIIDYSTSMYVQNEKERMRPVFAIYTTIGVVLCIVSVIPPIILDGLLMVEIEDLGGACVLLFVAIGVLLLVYQGNANTVYKRLLSLNGNNTIAGGYADPQNKEVVYINDTAATVMSVFWPTVTCIYLSISFLTFCWFITWIIWPVACIVHAILKSLLKK
ncbi:MAG: permease prefix domain 1-containing protein [Lachnospira sp.]